MHPQLKHLIAEFLKSIGIFKPALRLRLALLRAAMRADVIDAQTQVLQAITVRDADPQKRVLCLFASFDPQSVVDDYLVYYLQHLRSQLDADIVFVTTSEKLPPSEIQKLRPFCRTIIHRENIGIDFGSWKVGFEQTQDRDQYQTIILANDSCYGPLGNLNSITKLLAGPKPILAGITESLQYEPHLQSYFLAFNQAAIRTGCLQAFFSELRTYPSKKLVIHDCELGLSKNARAAGIELKAVFPYRVLERKTIAQEPRSRIGRLAQRKALNPTHHFWRTLLEEPQSLFIKVELVKKNPSELTDLDQLIPILRARGDYPPELIENHLRRFGVQIGGVPLARSP